MRARNFIFYFIFRFNAVCPFACSIFLSGYIYIVGTGTGNTQAANNPIKKSADIAPELALIIDSACYI